MNRSAVAVAAALLALSPAAHAQHAAGPEIMGQIQSNPAAAISDPAELIEEGRRLFFRETFGGNGRTCGTCHPATNNFTLDPAFIRKLPRRDPLFVAEFKPALRDLENPALMRQFGLILENLDGFENPGVMRGVPHTLALAGSRRPEAGTPQAALAEVLGWSGDGSPGNGSLRNFAVGAVTQHAPRTLNRVPGVDFRLPTEQELDALVAFQLSLGRQAEVAPLTFTDATVELGKVLFEGVPARDGSVRACSGCHTGAGAADADGENRNRANGTELVATAPACRGDAPGDGGFGQQPVTIELLCGKAVTFRGERTMNTPTLVEAADTGPFFHNNAVNTIEEAVAFYTSDTFNNSPTGAGRAFVLSDADVNAIGAFLRAINAVENIRESSELSEEAKRQNPARSRETLDQAVAETGDAIEVLTSAPEPLFSGTTAVARLRAAQALQRLAKLTPPPFRPAVLARAQNALTEARVQIAQP